MRTLLTLVVGFVTGYVAFMFAGVPQHAGPGIGSVPGVVVQAAVRGPILLPATATVPTEKLEDWGPQPVPIEAPPLSALHGMEVLKGGYGPIKAGIWECSVGKWRRQIMEAEFAYFMEGDAIFTPDGGTPIEIRAGDTVWFPPHTTGVWDIRAKARKTYILVGSPDYPKQAVALLKSLVR